MANWFHLLGDDYIDLDEVRRFFDGKVKFKGSDNAEAVAFGERADKLRRRLLNPKNEADVFADWLEEHDFAEAAAALRQAFKHD